MSSAPLVRRETILAFPLIGIRGDMGAGKDTLAAEVCELLPAYRCHKFAAKLREVVCLIADTTVDQTETAEGKARAIKHQWSRDYADALLRRVIECVLGPVVDGGRMAGYVAKFVDILLQPAAADAARPNPSGSDFLRLRDGMTVGRLLQLLGTECFREVVDADVWVDALLGPWADGGRPPTVIADVRFPNETAAIRAAGGVIVLVRRAAGGRADGREARHPSETALDGEAADFVIENNGTVDELRDAFAARWGDIRALSRRRLESAALAACNEAVRALRAESGGAV